MSSQLPRVHKPLGQQPRGQRLLSRLSIAALLLVVLLASSAAHLAARASSARQKSSADELHKKLDSIKQDVKEAVADSSRGLYKELHKATAGWVQDADVHHTARLGAACAALPNRTSSRHNSSSGSGAQHNHHGLQLDTSAGSGLVAPVVVLAHARSHYLAKTMLILHRHWSADPANAFKFPLFISLDGSHQPTLLLATSLSYAAGVQVIKVLRDAEQPPCNPPWDGYCNLSLHYKVLLQLFFECLQAPHLIFIEEDLQVAPDFFSYMEATAPLLDADPSLWCISAWNDHGQQGRASNVSALYRTDVFPGLGWLLTRSVGLELEPTWPSGYWDDNHMRKPHIRKGRQCVFPEVPRTHTFGAVGASHGMFYKEHLENMLINTLDMDWRTQDLSYLQADRYATLVRHWLSTAHPLRSILQDSKQTLRDFCNTTQPPLPAATSPHQSSSDMYITYKDNSEFERLGRELSPMLADVSGGAQIPRGVYNSTGHGLVIVRCRQRRLFLVQKDPAATPPR